MLIWTVYLNYWNFPFIIFYLNGKIELERAYDNAARRVWENHAAIS